MDSNFGKPEHSSENNQSLAATDALRTCIQSHHIALPSDFEPNGSGVKTSLISGGVEIADKETFLWFTADPHRHSAETDHFRNDGNSYEWRKGNLPEPGLFRLGADGAKMRVPVHSEEFASAFATWQAMDWKQPRCKS